jgi:hypothetical protein
MPDQLVIQNGQVTVVTDEGRTVQRDEKTLADMLRQEFVPPLGEAALPDGVKFVEWRPPFLLVVHQLPATVRRLRWIAADSPAKFGPDTRYRPVRISLPYAITFSVYYQRREALTLTGCNELYFRNAPLRSRTDGLCYPALLNVSAIPTPTRVRSWICTQYLQRPRGADWTGQLCALLEHTWNGGFNLSSEHHEGASWYGASRGVHPHLHPIEAWQNASEADPAFALQIAWKPAPLTVGQLIDTLLTECRSDPSLAATPWAPSKSMSLVQRFVNFSQRRQRAAAPSAAAQ